MNRFYCCVFALVLPIAFSSNRHQEEFCLISGFPIKKLAEEDVCRSEIFGKKLERIVEKKPSIDMTPFIQQPTKGQRLILVPRNSDLTIRLDDHVAYQLRQRQQVHNTRNDDSMVVPLQMNGFKVLSGLSDEIIQQHDSNHTFDRQIENEFSNEDVVPLLLKSHPGQALIPLHTDRISGGYMLEQLDYVEIGIGPESDAIQIRLQQPNELSRKRNIDDDTFRYSLVNADGLVFIVSSSQLTVGSPVTMTSWLNQDDDIDDFDIRVSRFVANFDYRCPFIINTDGSLSPFEAPHLAIGISRFPAVTLIERFSPNRLIFQDPETFWNAPAPVNGTALVLKSHPGLAVVSYPRYRGAFGLVNMMDVVVGPAFNDTYRTLKVFPRDNVIHHEFTLRNTYGEYLVPMNMKVDLDVPLRLMKYNVSQSTFVNVVLSHVLQKEKNATWIINLEGSISPLNAPHLVLGCKYISDFVDRDVGTKQRLMWQSNIVKDDSKNRNAVESTRTDDGNLSVHYLAWILIEAGYIRLVTLIVAIAMIIVIKFVPMSIWTILILQLTLGTVPCIVYVGFEISSLATKAIFKRFKKKNG